MQFPYEWAATMTPLALVKLMGKQHESMLIRDAGTEIDHTCGRRTVDARTATNFVHINYSDIL